LETPISACVQNRSFPTNYLTTTTLNYMSKLLPCTYIAKHVIQNILLYKSGHHLAWGHPTLAGPLEWNVMGSNSIHLLPLLAYQLSNLFCRKSKTIAINLRQQPNLTHSPCITSPLLAILCHSPKKWSTFKTAHHNLKMTISRNPNP
jgi:hypothetical protein